MTDTDIPLFLPPPVLVGTAAVDDPLTLPPLPAPAAPTTLLMTIAKIDHSGRIPAPDLIHALGWLIGDRTCVSLGTSAIIVRRAPADRSSSWIDSRRQVFIPAGARAHFNIHSADRLLLVAIPESALLIVHPITVVASILTAHYATRRSH